MCSPSTQIKIFILSVFLLGLHTFAEAQVATGDSLDLISILDNNCNNCPLENSSSPFYWDTSEPVSNWPGVTISGNRVMGISVSSRNLTGAFPPLPNCTNLMVLLCSNNQLTSLPDFYTNPLLFYLYCGNNQLTQIGSLNGAPFLVEFDCSNNQLTSLPSLQSASSLQQLICNDNQLASLPSISASSQLSILNCANNQLSQLPSLSTQQQLESFFCGFNQLTQLPDVSACQNLLTLDCRSNLIAQLPDLSSNTDLEYIYCQGNELLSLPNLSNQSNLKELACQNNLLMSIGNLDNFADLESINCSGNLLDSLPSFQNCTNLSTVVCNNNLLDTIPTFQTHITLQNVECRNNRLTFEEIVPLVQKGLHSLDYSPQDTIIIAPAITNSLPYTLNASSTGDSLCVFRWYKNNSLIQGATQAQYTITDSGLYYCRITHPNVPNLTLVTTTTQAIEDAPNCSKDVFEPNNQMSEAAILPRVGVLNNAMLCSEGDADWFQFQVSAQQNHIRVQMTDLAIPFTIELIDGNGTVLANSTAHGNFQEVRYNNLDASTTYYLKIAAVGNDFDAENAYRLFLQERSMPFANPSVNASIRDGQQATQAENELAEELATEIVVFPNPASRGQRIQIQGLTETTQLHMMDVNGRIVWEMQANSHTDIQIPSDMLEAGIYFLRLQNSHSRQIHTLSIQ